MEEYIRTHITDRAAHGALWRCWHCISFPSRTRRVKGCIGSWGVIPRKIRQQVFAERDGRKTKPLPFLEGERVAGVRVLWFGFAGGRRGERAAASKRPSGFSPTDPLRRS